MECISVFDMLKIGIGPSSSHTLGPWRAAEKWIAELKEDDLFDKVESIKVDLYGSLCLTGKGHATDLAVMLGLSGADPERVPVDSIQEVIDVIQSKHTLNFNGERNINFIPESNIIFDREFLPFHANGMTFTAGVSGKEYTSTFYSIGGGFVVKEESYDEKDNLDIQKSFPFPIQKATELLKYCEDEHKSISEIVFSLMTGRLEIGFVSQTLPER